MVAPMLHNNKNNMLNTDYSLHPKLQYVYLSSVKTLFVIILTV